MIAFPALAQTWTQTSAPYDSWYAIASSADGNKLVAVSASGNIYTSTNFGQVGCFNTTWPVRFGEVWHLRQTGANWCRTAICGIYTSTNSGATWTQTSAPSKIWNAIASSADGNRLVAAAGFYAGPIYISTNAGTTWTQSSAPTTNAWFSVDSSVDGTKLAAVTLDNHGIYVSTNSGINWTRSGAPMISWRSIALSADGNKLVAVGNSNIYVSTDSGMTWVQQTNLPSAYFSAVDSSADGGKLVAVVDAFDGNIYTSQSEDCAVVEPCDFRWQRLCCFLAHPLDKFCAATKFRPDFMGGYD